MSKKINSQEPHDGHEMPVTSSFTAFSGGDILARGSREVIAAALLRDPSLVTVADHKPLLVFDDETGKQTDLDLRKKLELPVADAGIALLSDAARKPGRPKLGVVAREVTLLPRHWEWLNHQPGGASVALRRLVEDARRANAPVDTARRAREAAYAFISAIAGDFVNFEEVARALFAGDAVTFGALMESWPPDVRTYAHELAAPGLTGALSATPDQPASGSPPNGKPHQPAGGVPQKKNNPRTSL